MAQIPIPSSSLEFKTREYYIENTDPSTAKGDTLTFQELDKTLLYLSQSIVGVPAYNFTTTFVNQSIWNVTHNLGYQYVLIQVFDEANNQIIPEEINLVDANNAQITFNSNVTGTVVATVGGATFSNSQLPAEPAYSVQYNDGGGGWGGSSIFQFDGTSVTIYEPTEARLSFSNENVLYNASQITQRTILDGDYLNSLGDIGNGILYTGTILTGVGKITSLNTWDLAFLDTDNEWKAVFGNNSGRDSRLLGIYVVGKGSILTEGHITVGLTGSVSPGDVPFISGTLTPGAPVYLTGNGGSGDTFLTTTMPTTPGDTVRVVGHLIQQVGVSDYWTMYFRPDHSWVEVI